MKLLVFICSPFAPFLDGSMGRALYLNNRYKSVEFLKLHIYDEYFVFVSDFRCSHFMCGASQKHKFYGMVNKNDVSIQRFWLQCRDRILALSILWLRHISDEVLISAPYHSDTNASTHIEPVPWISYYGPGMFFSSFWLNFVNVNSAGKNALGARGNVFETLGRNENRDPYL